MNWLWHGKSNVVFKTKETQKKDTLKRNIITFASLAVAVLFIAGFFMLLSYDFDITNLIGTSTAQIVDDDKSYVIKKIKSEKTVLMYITDDDEKNVKYMALVKFQMKDREIKIYPLSCEDKIFDLHSKKVNASACYRDTGVLQLKNAVEKYAQITVDKYIGCKEGSVEGIAANFDELEVDFSGSATFKEGSESLSFNKGKQTVSDDNIVKVLTYDTDNENVRNDLLLSIFRRYFNKNTLNNRNIIYSNIVNQTTTDISIVDFTSYKDSIVLLSSDAVEKKYNVASSLEEFRED